jgi:septal ring factor EnvC (AmiA/AmiB activator)
MLASLIVLAPAAHAQTASTNDSPQERLGRQTETLKQKQGQASVLEGELKQLEQERARLNRELIETAKAVQRSEAQLSEAEARIEELEAQETLVRGSLAQSHGRISQLMAAMQRMGRNPPPVMITQREDALRMVRSAMLLANAFPELREQALLLTGKLNELVRVMSGIRTESARLKSETQRLTETRVRLDGLLTQKRDTVTARQDELHNVRTAMTELSRSVRDLNELITKMDQTVSDQAGITKYNEKLAALPDSATGTVRDAPPVAPSPGIQAPVAAPPVDPPGARKLEVGPRVAMVNPGRITPSIPFDKAHGRLPLPVQGRRIHSFGERTDLGEKSKGIVIETRPSAQVVSPADGWVVYAGEFRSFHQLLIINAGAGYHIVLAGLNRVSASVGQFVLSGEPVGTMRETARPQRKSRQNSEPSKVPDSAPVLYVEFRKEGRPIDPSPWWATATAQKVQE